VIALMRIFDCKTSYKIDGVKKNPSFRYRCVIVVYSFLVSFVFRNQNAFFSPLILVLYVEVHIRFL